jgi:hypothetical protein
MTEQPKTAESARDRDIEVGTPTVLPRPDFRFPGDHAQSPFDVVRGGCPRVRPAMTAKLYPPEKLGRGRRSVAAERIDDRLARKEQQHAHLGVDIGMDIGSPIDFTYKMPFAFTGRIEKVTVELKPKK